MVTKKSGFNATYVRKNSSKICHPNFIQDLSFAMILAIHINHFCYTLLFPYKAPVIFFWDILYVVHQHLLHRIWCAIVYAELDRCHGCRVFLKGVLWNRINLISEERVNISEQTSENLMKIS